DVRRAVQTGQRHTLTPPPSSWDDASVSLSRAFVLASPEIHRVGWSTVRELHVNAQSRHTACRSTAFLTGATMAKKKKAAKRELVKPSADARYVRRNAQGDFKESDDVGTSQRQDRKKKAKTAVKSGQGDKGDRKTAKKAKR